ncbi:hypothetical protein QBZ16_001682 [Prototheca wickerhamii]|uniref:Uncharacterized protein n=1 Tax=Prototheca wickerhamii TaxID=3111 RepID=A0AAD9ID20_PROWI|nr:hypothetical protein QBZ16_001682 [Prototheca wickerhamii]
MADYDAPERGLFGSGRSWFGKRTAPPFTLLDLRLQNLFPIRVTLSRTGILPARVGLRKDIVFLDLIRKRFPLPNGLWVSANAGVQHVGTSVRQSIRDQFHPFVGAHLELGGGPGDDNIVFGGASGLSWKQRIPAYSNVQFPALTTFQGPLASRGSERFEATSGIQAAPGQALTVHIDHYNLIFDL